MDLRSKGRASQQKGNPSRSAPTEKNVTHSPSYEQFVQTDSKKTRRKEENRENVNRPKQRTKQRENQISRPENHKPHHCREKSHPPGTTTSTTTDAATENPTTNANAIQTLDQSAVSEPDIVCVIKMREKDVGGEGGEGNGERSASITDERRVGNDKDKG